MGRITKIIDKKIERTKKETDKLFSEINELSHKIRVVLNWSF